MKKSILITIFLLSFLPALRAGVVSPADAKDYAARFFGMNAASTKSSVSLVPVDFHQSSGATKAVVSKDPAFYVFNRSNGGFVIVSAESEYHPLLCYSFTESFDVANLPDGFQYMLESLQNDIFDIRMSGEKADAATAAEWGQSFTGISYDNATKVLETAEWGQRYPYNVKCPIISGETSPSVTGCVATASAIVLRYQAGRKGDEVLVPAQTTIPSYSYTKKSVNTTIPAHSLVGRSYNLAEMPLYITDQTELSADVIEDMGNLLFDIGSALEMKYSSSGSGSNTENVVKVLGTYFGYNKNNKLETRDAYTEEEWAAKIRAGIDAENPIVVAGNSGTGGHCFILDGYDSNGLFRFNYGWNGSYHDTFVRLCDRYDLDQGAIFNLVPDPTGTSEFPVPDLSFYSSGDGFGIRKVSSGPITSGQEFKLGCAVSGSGPVSLGFHLRAVLVSGDTRTPISIGTYSKSSLSVGYYMNYDNIRCRIDTPLKFGDAVEIEYSTDISTSYSQVTDWIPLRSPADGSAVYAYPVIPAFAIDMPTVCQRGTRYALLMKNGDIPWSYNSEWTWSSADDGASATVSVGTSDNRHYVVFHTPGVYDIKSSVNDGGAVVDNVIARVTVE